MQHMVFAYLSIVFVLRLGPLYTNKLLICYHRRQTPSVAWPPLKALIPSTLHTQPSAGQGKHAPST